MVCEQALKVIRDWLDSQSICFSFFVFEAKVEPSHNVAGLSVLCLHRSSVSSQQSPITRQGIFGRPLVPHNRQQSRAPPSDVLRIWDKIWLQGKVVAVTAAILAGFCRFCSVWCCDHDHFQEWMLLACSTFICATFTCDGGSSVPDVDCANGWLLWDKPKQPNGSLCTRSVQMYVTGVSLVRLWHLAHHLKSWHSANWQMCDAFVCRANT